MKTIIIHIVAILAGWAPHERIMSQPLATSRENINSCIVYKDELAPNVFYYQPFSYKMATDKNGRPLFSLLQMRYLGSRATANQGSVKYHNIMQFRIAADAESILRINEVKEILKQRMTNAILKPLPVTKFETLLVYAPVHNVDSSLKILTSGYSEATPDATSLNNTFWTDRTFTIRLSDEDAELMEAALKTKQAGISMAYAFYTKFSSGQNSTLSVTTNGLFNKKMLNYFDSSVVKNTDSLSKNVLIKADAIPIQIDTDTWTDAIQKININEKLPPNYPLFDVYCYDFSNAIRPDLYVKKIEIKTSSVNGSEITSISVFRRSQPDQYAQSIRFQYAVRFDKPYQYRVIEVDNNGETKTSPWTESTSWSNIIDITTRTNP